MPASRPPAAPGGGGTGAGGPAVGVGIVGPVPPVGCGVTGMFGVAAGTGVKADVAGRVACWVSADVLLIALTRVLLARLGGPLGPALAGCPEFWREKPERCADWSGAMLALAVAPSSWFSAAPRAPCFSRLGIPGTPPAPVTICEPGRVAVWVWPPAVTVMLLPNTKLATVSVGVTVTMVMPPRMPMVLDGVVMVMALAC